MRGLRKHLRRSIGDDRGAGAVEYVAVILLVVAVLGSVVLAATPAGTAIAMHLCRAVGGTCEGTTPVEQQPDQVCSLGSSSKSGGYGVSVLMFEGGREGTYELTQMRDGTYRATLTGAENLGIVASAGEGLGTVEILEGGLRVGAEASVGVGLRGVAGVEIELKDDAEVAQFERWLTTRGVAAGVVSLGQPGMPAPVVGVQADMLGRAFDVITGTDYTPSVPSTIWVEGGAYVNGGGTMSGGLAGATGSAEFQNGLGARVDTETGNITAYARVSVDGSYAAQIGLSKTNPTLGNGALGSGQVEVVVGATYDTDGELVELTFDGAATREGAYELSGMFGAPLKDNGSDGIALSTSLPVTAANRAAVERSLTQVLTMQPPTGSDPGQGGWVEGLTHLTATTASDGTVTAQRVAVSSTQIADIAFGLKAPGVGGIGLSGGASTGERTTTDAWYLDDSGWKDWTECVA